MLFYYFAPNPNPAGFPAAYKTPLAVVSDGHLNADLLAAEVAPKSEQVP